MAGRQSSVISLQIILTIIFYICANDLETVHSLSIDTSSSIDRRTALSRAITAVGTTSTTATIATSILSPNIANAASAGETSTTNYTPGGLASKLSKRDPSALKNSVFNIPPSAQVYPSFLRGTWDLQMNFRGYIFPSDKIPKQKITSNVQIPGFQKLSVVQISDIGKDNIQYQMTIDPTTGYDHREMTIPSMVNSHLDKKVVDQVIYDVKSNPNRLSIDFLKGQTRNAERIELFCNARESELVQRPFDTSTTTSSESSSSITQNVFVCSEYIRQVTFSYSQEFGVARQVVGNYAHFWTWRENPLDGNSITGNVLTAAYLDPQDPMFFDEPSKPVAVYSHDLVAKRVTG